MFNGIPNHPYNPNIGLLAQLDHFCHPLPTELEQCAVVAMIDVFEFWLQDLIQLALLFWHNN